MPGWQGSDRAKRLPKDWHRRRARARREAGNLCQAVVHAPLCTGVGSQCDHIVRPDLFLGPDPDVASNLQWLSEPCHKAKTLSERSTRPSQRADRERHPGLL